mgnify:CR=1 FL=1
MAVTQRQKLLIQESFLKVEPIADVAADIFYKKLFEYDPSLKALFKGDMKKQGVMLMSTLKVAVKGLDNLEELVPVLQKLAIKHLDYGVKVEDYTPVGNALIFALKTGLADAFTEELKNAWIAVYKVIANVMREAAYPEFDGHAFQNAKKYNH